MCGSLGHFGAERRDQALRPVPGSLTVCAGDLCGRLAGGELSILQTFVTEQQVNSNGKRFGASQRVISSLGRTSALKALAKVFGLEPKNLSEEFDPGSE